MARKKTLQQYISLYKTSKIKALKLPKSKYRKPKIKFIKPTKLKKVKL